MGERLVGTGSPSATFSGPGRLVVGVYAVFALAAGARAGVQIATRFSEAPLAYVLSALSAVVYLLAAVALGTGWRRSAWATVSTELLGVLMVGTISVVLPRHFPDATVWSMYGSGYVFLPVLLPVVGLLWLYRTRASSSDRRSPVACGTDARSAGHPGE